jgi:hypothetical protein
VFQDGESQAEALRGGRLGIGEERVDGSESLGSPVLGRIAQIKQMGIAGVTDSLRKIRGMQPSVDGDPIQSRGGGGRGDVGAMG